MIEAIGLTKRYGRIAAIQDVSFRVGDGEIVGFLGPNGAGKTTTMRVLTGFSPASNGMAVIAGIDVQNDPIGVRSRVGYVPENAALYDEMRLDKYLHYVATIKGVPRARRSLEIARVMERCGLEPVAQRIIRHLSKGYRQRAGLAQALVGDPPVLILDEPTVGLDPQQIMGIRETIRELAGDHTVLLSTHILHEVENLCKRVVIINRGRIIADQRLDTLTGAGQTVAVSVTSAGAEAEAILSSIDGIDSVRGESPGRFTLSGSDVRPERIAKAVSAAGLNLSALEPRSRTLEDVFLEALAASAESREIVS